MPIVKAYQCPHTGQFWAIDDRDNYKKHLNRLSNERARERRLTRERLEHEAFFQESVNTLNCIEDIEQWAMVNFKRFWRRANHWPGDRISRFFKITNVSIGLHNVSKITKCSNTHSCPRGDKTQWGGKSTYDDGTLVPRGRPGWNGNIRIEYEGNSPSATSDAFSAMGLCTGSGGGGGQALTYGLTMWAKDWPALRKCVEANQIVERLKGNG